MAGDGSEVLLKEAQIADESLLLEDGDVAGTVDHRIAVADVPPLASDEEGVSDISVRFPTLAKHQSYPDGSVRARLVVALNACIVAGRVPRSNDQTKIFRKHFSDLLGVAINSVKNQADVLADYEAILHIVEPVNSVVKTRFGVRTDTGSDGLDDNARQVIALYPALEKHQFYELGRNAFRLVAELNGQIVKGKIERSRTGKFNRTLLSEKTGIKLSMLCSTYSHITDDYANALGGLGSIFEEKIPEMRRWLEERMSDGTLELRDGKFNRSQFYTAFGETAEFWIRKHYPSVAELIEEFDEKIRTTGYQPRVVVDTLAALQAILDTDPPTDQNGLNISRAELERRLGVPGNAFRRSPYIEVQIPRQSAP